jgi:hypothetical protein
LVAMIEHNLEVINTADWIIARTGYLRGSHPNESARLRPSTRPALQAHADLGQRPPRKTPA